MSDNTPPVDPTSKNYSLNNNEAELLVFVKRQLDGVFSSVITHIAASRLGYHVTEKTQFGLSQDFKTLTISETALRPQPPTDNAEGAVQAA